MQVKSATTLSIKVFGVPARWAGIVLGLTLVLICTTFTALLWAARVAEQEKASTAVANLSAALTQDVARNLELYDLSIQAVVDGLANPQVMGATPQMRQLILFDRAATAPFLGAIIVTDDHGDVRLDSASVSPRSFNYSDRTYYKVQAARSDLGLYISEPVLSKTDNQWVIGLSRRYNKQDGSFGGVVVGTLRLEYLHRLFSRLKLGNGGSLTLFRTDGTIIMREPYDPGVLGRRLTMPIIFERLADAPEGEYEAKSSLDGTNRLYHYQRVGSFPLVQNVAMSIDYVYADWWRKTIEVSSVLAIACLIIITLGAMLNTELKRRTEAEIALTTLAGEDPLTKLSNRRRFDEVLAEEMRRASRHGWPLSLLLLDADHFKAYNDSFGHVAGDAALVSLASCLLRRTKRSGDLAARYGGEEFAVIFPHVGPEDAFLLGEAIRQDVYDLKLRSPGSRHDHFSVSVGIASVYPEAQNDPAQLIETADAALYASKAGGRNQCTLFRKLDERDPATDRAA